MTNTSTRFLLVSLSPQNKSGDNSGQFVILRRVINSPLQKPTNENTSLAFVHFRFRARQIPSHKSKIEITDAIIVNCQVEWPESNARFTNGNRGSFHIMEHFHRPSVINVRRQLATKSGYQPFQENMATLQKIDVNLILGAHSTNTIQYQIYNHYIQRRKQFFLFAVFLEYVLI